MNVLLHEPWHTIPSRASHCSVVRPVQMFKLEFLNLYFILKGGGDYLQRLPKSVDLDIFKVA